VSKVSTQSLVNLGVSQTGLCGLFLGFMVPTQSLTELLWEELAGVYSWWEVPWCIVADFNMIRFSSGRPGEGRTSAAIWEFSNFISELGLLVLPLLGGILPGPIIRSLLLCLG
jgi:hypothetical protein